MVQIFLFFQIKVEISRPLQTNCSRDQVEKRRRTPFGQKKKLCKTKLIIPIVLRFYLYIESENIGDRVGLVPSKSFDVRESIRDRNGCLYDVTFLYFLYPCRKRSMLLPFRVYSFMPLRQWSPSPKTITIENINILSNVDFYVI